MLINVKVSDNYDCMVKFSTLNSNKGRINRNSLCANIFNPNTNQFEKVYIKKTALDAYNLTNINQITYSQALPYIINTKQNLFLTNNSWCNSFKKHKTFFMGTFHDGLSLFISANYPNDKTGYLGQLHRRTLAEATKLKNDLNNAIINVIKQMGVCFRVASNLPFKNFDSCLTVVDIGENKLLHIHGGCGAFTEEEREWLQQNGYLIINYFAVCKKDEYILTKKFFDLLNKIHTDRSIAIDIEVIFDNNRAFNYMHKLRHKNEWNKFKGDITLLPRGFRIAYMQNCIKCDSYDINMDILNCLEVAIFHYNCNYIKEDITYDIKVYDAQQQQEVTIGSVRHLTMTCKNIYAKTLIPFLAKVQRVFNELYFAGVQLPLHLVDWYKEIRLFIHTEEELENYKQKLIAQASQTA